MGYPLRPETIERISARQVTPDFSLLDAARIEFEAADIVARSLAEWGAKQEPPELPVDAVIEALRELANMTAEEEARLNQIILDQEAGL
jgi:hypothetical protein